MTGAKGWEHHRVYRGYEIQVKQTKTPLYGAVIGRKRYLKASPESCKKLIDTWIKKGGRFI